MKTDWLFVLKNLQYMLAGNIVWTFIVVKCITSKEYFGMALLVVTMGLLFNMQTSKDAKLILKILKECRIEEVIKTKKEIDDGSAHPQ